MTSGIFFEQKELQELLSNVHLPLKKKIPPRTKKKKVIVIAGPTGVGKTDLSMTIAGAIGGEIISADSMQVYRGMDIGTSKVDKESQEKVRHHLIDIRDLSESFNVVDFYHEAHAAIRECFLKEHVPIVVGGTGFYLHALLYGPPSGPPAEPEIREKLENEMKEKGSFALYERLRLLDPDYALTITQGDKHKIVRALEIITLTNQKVSHFSKILSEKEQEYDFRCWFLTLPKAALYPRIEARCDEMLQKGFLDEVRSLKEAGLEQNSSASQSIGYRQALDFLKTDQSPKEVEKFIKAFKQASRRYAKRQFTWFRKEPLFRWLDLSEKTVDTAIEMIIQDYEIGF